jgi:nucleotide-binding universal stress UspA family protein
MRPKILHPTDFSVEADAAEAEAVRLARRLGGELILLHVAAETAVYAERVFGRDPMRDLSEAEARWAESRLAERASALEGEGLPTRWRRSIGEPPERICDVAREERVDYIVMGTHGRTGLERVMLGSVADRVMREAPCPVLTVRRAPAAHA